MVSGQQHALAAFYPQEKPGTHCTVGWVGPSVVLDWRKISPPPGFDPRTVQPVVSRYTEYATRPAVTVVAKEKIGGITYVPIFVNVESRV